MPGADPNRPSAGGSVGGRGQVARHRRPTPVHLVTRDMRLTPDDPRQILVASFALGSHLHLRLGSGPPMFDQGTGGYTEVTRPNQRSMTSWPGVSPFKMTLSVMLDQWAHEHHRDLEKDVRKLLELGVPKKPGKAPPPLRVYGRSTSPFNGDAWVMSDPLAWGDALRSQRGKLLRRSFTITLLKFEDPDDVNFRRRSARHSGDGSKAKRYHVKAGDTLMSIAQKFYGDWHKWKKIADRNKIKNPRKLQVGQLLIIPDAH